MVEQFDAPDLSSVVINHFGHRGCRSPLRVISGERRTGGGYVRKILLPLACLSSTALAAPQSEILEEQQPPSPEQWATCIATSVPETARNWLRAPAVNYIASNRWDEKPQNLGIRLQAACYRQLIPNGKISSGMFPIQEVRELLRSVMGRSIATDNVDPKALTCRIQLEGTFIGIDWGFGNSSEMEIIIASRFIRSVDDVQTFKIAAEAGTLQKQCFRIESDGTLTPA